MRSGFLDSERLVVSGTTLYRGSASTSVGTIAGSGRVSMDASATELRIANGTNVYKYDGTTLAVETMPTGGGWVHVSYLNGFWFAVENGTQKLYYLQPGSVIWDALDFVSAEKAPDTLQAAVPVNDELWLFGIDSLEVWALTGQPDPPIARVGGVVFERGCNQRNTIAQGDNTVYWVGQDNSLAPTVYRGRNGPEKVSNPAIEQKLVGKSNMEAFFVTLDGHELYVLSFDNAPSLTYDATTESWAEWADSAGATQFISLAAAVPGGVPVFAGRTGAQLYSVATNASTDAGVAFTTTLSGFLPIGGQVRCNRASLECSLKATATTEVVQVRLKTSDDLGAIWVDHGLQTVGLQGRNDNRVEWRRLGLMRPPGRVFEISCAAADPLIYRALEVD